MTAPTSMPTALVATGSARGVSLTTIPASASRSATPKASAMPATGMFSEIRSAARTATPTSATREPITARNRKRSSPWSGARIR